MPDLLTPVENRNGRLYKREDLHTLGPVNGSKLRACQHLLSVAQRAGATQVISASSVLSPQSAMAATVARSLGMRCTCIYGATKPETIQRHAAPRIAAQMGAHFEYVKVGFNPYIQRKAWELQGRLGGDPGNYLLHYGITPGLGEDIEAFHASGADSVRNLPAELDTLVLPFGSGNTAAGVLYGLHKYPLPHLRRIVLVGIGPSRRDWLADRMHLLGAQDVLTGHEFVHYDLHGEGYASYAQRMPGSLDGIVLHPTYEGKVARYLDHVVRPDWWTRRDGRTCLWIVGGPLAEQGEN